MTCQGLLIRLRIKVKRTSEDKVRVDGLLLPNTILRVKGNHALSNEFRSLLGLGAFAFQGACLSGCLFTFALPGAML